VSQSTRELLAETPLQDVDVRDLGRHRLQDLGPPWRLFQLVDPELVDETSAPRSLDSYRTNLPSIATTLVGRDAEIRELTESLAAHATRLVTLTGPAGVGKTRLALQTAARLLDDFDDGVYFVDLSSLADPDSALHAAAGTVGAPEDESAPAEQLAQHLRGRRMLVVLDNLEHLLAIAPALERVAESMGGSKLLATSRVPLRLDLEREYKVEPLAVPMQVESPEGVLGFDAVALFEARARSVSPDFELSDANAGAVSAICRSLDGLPLAIELAASRIAILSPVDLEQRLDQRLRLLRRGPGRTVERHRTLRAAIDWSYDLLGLDEQRLLAYLSIFVGGFTLEAVESVCGCELDAVDGLATLVDANLVRQSGADREPRFALLETVREYAAGRLEHVTGADGVRDRHAQHFLELAERAEPHLREAPGEWINRLDPEQGNLRAALDRFEHVGKNRELLHLAGALWRFWYLTGQLAEGGRRLERALELDHAATPERAKGLLGAAVMAGNQGDSLMLKQRAEEALSVSRAVGDVWTAAYAKHMSGNALNQLGEPQAAAQLFEESAAEFRELGDEHSALIVTRNLARVREASGDVDGARAIHEENLRRARQTHNPRIEASTLGALAMIAAAEGRELDALAAIRQSLIIHRNLGAVPDSALDLYRCACLLARGGSVETAARLFTFDRLNGDVGMGRLSMSDPNEQAWSAAREKLGKERIEAALAEVRSMTLDDALALAIKAL
jgi:predicted ATPase